MKVALIFGVSQGDTIKPRLKEVRDNLDIDSYNDIGSFINGAVSRRIDYDRILISSRFCNINQIQDLHTYWSIKKSSEIILICSKEKDDELAKKFLTVFNTPSVAVMSLESTAFKYIKQSVILSVDEINTQFGFSDYLVTEFIDDEITLDSNKSKEEETDSNNEQEQKGGFLSRFSNKNKKHNRRNRHNRSSNNDQNNQNNTSNNQKMPMQNNVQAPNINPVVNQSIAQQNMMNPAMQMNKQQLIQSIQMQQQLLQQAQMQKMQEDIAHHISELH